MVERAEVAKEVEVVARAEEAEVRVVEVAAATVVGTAEAAEAMAVVLEVAVAETEVVGCTKGCNRRTRLRRPRIL